jgi:hypothetical protein
MSVLLGTSMPFGSMVSASSLIRPVTPATTYHVQGGIQYQDKEWITMNDELTSPHPTKGIHFDVLQIMCIWQPVLVHTPSYDESRDRLCRSGGREAAKSSQASCLTCLCGAHNNNNNYTFPVRRPGVHLDHLKRPR